MTQTNIKLINPPESQRRYTNSDINNITLNVPFTDLSQLNDSQIAVKRMRSLIRMADVVFTINGRTDFHKGKSENPTIGTV